MSQAGSLGGGGGGGVTFPITVPEGGTGLTSIPAGDILFGSGGNPLSLLAPPSVPGQVLTYNGTQPIWSGISTVMTMQDDFISNSSMGILGWVNVSGGGGSFDASQQISTATHPGVWLLRSNGAFSSASVQQNTSITFGGGAMTIEWIARIVNLSNATDRFNIQIGTGDVFNGSPTTNGVYFSYQDNLNTGNWQLIAVNGGVATTTNSTTAADTSFHRFTIIVNAAGTSAQFFIDGVSVGTVASNIPTTNLTSFHIEINNTGASSAVHRDLWVDAFQCFQQLTTPR
jgi:hypothetical protein